MTDHIIDYMIIKFHDILITFILNINFDKYIGIWDYSLAKKKYPKPNKKLKKKLYILISKKFPKLDEKIKKKTKRFN